MCRYSVQDPELVVEAMSSGSSSRPARQPAPSSSSSAATGGEARPQNSGVTYFYLCSTLRLEQMVMLTSMSSRMSPASPILNGTFWFHFSGSSARNAGASATSSPTPTSLRWDRQTIQFSVNAWVQFLFSSQLMFILCMYQVTNPSHS